MAIHPHNTDFKFYIASGDVINKSACSGLSSLTIRIRCLLCLLHFKSSSHYL